MSYLNNITIKHRQHYVFQAYLNRWVTNNQIWCCRNGKSCFSTNTVNIAQQRDFYRIKEINEDEEKFILLFLHKQPKENVEIMRRQMEIYKKPLTWQKGIAGFISVIKSKIYKEKTIPKELEEAFEQSKKLAEEAVNDMVEDIYSEDEGQLIKMLDLLIQEDLTFYYTPYHTSEMVFDDSKRAFLYYLCSQHYRTKAALNRLVEGLNNILNSDLCEKLGINKDNIRPEHIAHHIFWYIEGMLADVLYNKNAHLTLLYNHTETPFVTSDQPIINVLADYQDINDEVEDIIFYYPISPEIAITVNDNNTEDKKQLTEAEVEKYNKMLIDASYEFVFANSEKTIKKYYPSNI